MSVYHYFGAVPILEDTGGFIVDWQGYTKSLKSGDRMLAVGDARLHEPAMKV